MVTNTKFTEGIQLIIFNHFSHFFFDQLKNFVDLSISKMVSLLVMSNYLLYVFNVEDFLDLPLVFSDFLQFWSACDTLAMDSHTLEIPIIKSG